MAETDTSRTAIDRPFAGRSRRFQLRLGEIGELERICGAGIGEIMLRVAGHRFHARDVWDTIRLGLEGGGESEPVATGLAMRYADRPIADYIGLATEILNAAVSGVPIPPEPGGNGYPEGAVPETSPSTTRPARRRGSRRKPSGG